MGTITVSKLHIQVFMELSLFCSYSIGSLVRQAYLEISLLCLNALSKFDAQLLSERADEVSLGEPVKDRSLNVSVRPSKTVATTSTGKHSKQQQQQKSLKKEKEEKLKTKERQRLRKAAWLAIRTAGAIAKAQKRLGLLTGDPSITSHMIIEKAAQRIPQYSLYDLLGTDEMIQNDENESMVDPTGLVIIPSAQQRQEEFQLSWVHMVKYAAHLKRQLTYGTMGLGSPQTFLVRAALQSEKQALKLEGIHRYLREHLIVYDKECCPILPKDSLLDLASSSTQLPAAGNVSGDKEEHDSKRIEKTSVTLDVLELDDQGTLSRKSHKLLFVFSFLACAFQEHCAMHRD